MSKAARDLGIPKDTVSRAVAAENLPDEVKAAADEAGLGTVKRAELARKEPVKTRPPAGRKPSPRGWPLGLRSATGTS